MAPLRVNLVFEKMVQWCIKLTFSCGVVVSSGEKLKTEKNRKKKERKIVM
jgi:hypothetical protein